MTMKEPETLPAFVEIEPDKWIALEKLTVEQLRRSLVVEQMDGTDERFRDPLWLRRQIPLDAKDTDLVVECAGIKVRE